MGDRLEGKVVIVTGAARGLGAAVVRRFAAEGAAVLASDIRDELGRGVAEELQAAGYPVEYVRLDVALESDWEQGVASCAERFGGLDVLVNNAGIATTNAIHEETLESWQRVIDVNLTGVFLGMRAVIPLLRERGGGSIVNISSTWGLVGVVGAASYQASKAGVHLLSKNAALTYAADGIRVNSVHPGPIATPFAAEIGNDPEQADVVAITPLRRQADPDEIAAGILFLASDEASYVTGHGLVIDGGYTAP
jgi:NAD(P)-dependent dehydrogenase (short-subunit alcohol dehydrogenase family)